MMLLGKYFQNPAYRPWMTVDVRDDAECHIRLLENVSVQNGDRYIAWSTDTRNVEDICASIDRLLPELGHATPKSQIRFLSAFKPANKRCATSGHNANCAMTVSARSQE